MHRREFLTRSLLSAAAVPAIARRAAAAAKQPNIIILLADDLGYGDVHAFNPVSKIPTPNLDGIAAGGMMFTNAHAGCAVCTPTRYGVVTGRYSWRTSMKSGVLNGYSKPMIERDRLTVAQLMKNAGYRTGCVGKWHLGMGLPLTGGKDADGSPAVDWNGRIDDGPADRGFEYNFNVLASLDMPPYVFAEGRKFVGAGTEHYPGSDFPRYVRSGPMAPDFVFEDCLDILISKAVGFIRESSQGEQPFFLYLPLTAPHKPAWPHPRWAGKSGLGPYGDFLMQVDEAVGRVDRALSESGVAENTLLLITSDNGSYMYRLDQAPEKERSKGPGDHVTTPAIQAYDPAHHQANAEWRGTKADIWEGGHRVPFIGRWPGVVQAGSACDAAICHTDLMATCAEAAGVKVPQGAAEDSYSIVPLLQGGKPETRRPPVVHQSGNGTLALRDGKWKLIFGSGSGGRGNPGSNRWEEPYQLYDMIADPGETKNLIDNPECGAALAQCMDWADKLGILAERAAAKK